MAEVTPQTVFQEGITVRTCFRCIVSGFSLYTQADSRHRTRRSTPRQYCVAAQQTTQQLHDIIPEQVAEIEESAAWDMFRGLQSVEISMPECTVQSTFVGPAESSPEHEGATPVVLLHGFDGSCIEFRRMKPFLDPHVQAWALDLLGNGFCASGLEARPDAQLGPEQRRQHLYAFWQQQIRRPVTMVGTSLGGAVAIDFALTHPDAVERLVLLAPQIMTDGIGPMSSLPPFAARLGVKVLQAFWLRNLANQMAYHDKDRFATADAVRIGRLHTFLQGWVDATVAFMRSGGYVVSKRIKEVQQPITLVWGENDEVLDPKGGEQLLSILPHARLVMLPQCGHCSHLEQPQRTAEIVLETVGLSQCQDKSGNQAALPVA